MTQPPEMSSQEIERGGTPNFRWKLKDGELDPSHFGVGGTITTLFTPNTPTDSRLLQLPKLINYKGFTQDRISKQEKTELHFSFPHGTVSAMPSVSAPPAAAKWPKISIITPSYNQGKFLEQTIRSILDQAYPNLEYIIIDGGSSDNSEQIIRKYAKHLKYWVSEPDGGQADAINKGFRHASGEICGWLNSDDILMPGSLTLLAKLFQQLPQVSWVSSTPQTITQHGYVQHLGLRPVYWRWLVAAGVHHGRGLGFLMQEGTFWRRSLWEKAGDQVQNLHYGMDFELWRRFAQLTFVLPVHLPLAAFRLNPERKSKAIQRYYQEVGVWWPAWLSWLGKLLRLGLQLPRKLRLTRQFYYDLDHEEWVYLPDLWSRLTGRDQVQRFQ